MKDVFQGLTALVLVLGTVLAVYYVSIALALATFVILVLLFIIFVLWAIGDWVHETLFRSKK